MQQRLISVKSIRNLPAGVMRFSYITNGIAHYVEQIEIEKERLGCSRTRGGGNKGRKTEGEGRKEKREEIDEAKIVRNGEA